MAASEQPQHVVLILSKARWLPCTSLTLLNNNTHTRIYGRAWREYMREKLQKRIGLVSLRERKDCAQVAPLMQIAQDCLRRQYFGKRVAWLLLLRG